MKISSEKQIFATIAVIVLIVVGILLSIVLMKRSGKIWPNLLQMSSSTTP